MQAVVTKKSDELFLILAFSGGRCQTRAYEITGTIYPRSRSVFTNQKYEAFLCLMERLDAKDLRHTVLKNLNFRNKSREHIVLTQDGRFRITQADNGEDINS